ncbi:MAG: hypothetical protein FH756_15120 [Firmicutes bacterium]|nr:hypothetical protein [Bacillota bacterium]
MQCTNHAEKEAEAICSDCSIPVCHECMVEVAGQHFCRSCLEKRIMNQTEHISEEPISSPGNKSKFWAFVSSLIPGVGYMYLGLMRRGLESMILFFGTIFVSSIIHMDELVPFVLPVIFFYSIFDTQRLVGQMIDGYQVRDQALLDWEKIGSRSTIIAYVLIGLGTLALLNNLLPQVFFYNGLANRLVPPLLILGLGIFILYRSTRKGGSEDGI